MKQPAPMTLDNMRGNGVPSLMVFCSARKDCERMPTVTIYRCPHSAPGCAANGAADLALMYGRIGTCARYSVRDASRACTQKTRGAVCLLYP
jgi:hypothetical protein